MAAGWVIWWLRRRDGEQAWGSAQREEKAELSNGRKEAKNKANNTRRRVAMTTSRMIGDGVWVVGSLLDRPGVPIFSGIQIR